MKSRETINQITSIISDLSHLSLLFHCCFLFQITMVCHIRYDFRVLFHTKCFRVVCHLREKEKLTKRKITYFIIVYFQSAFSSTAPAVGPQRLQISFNLFKVLHFTQKKTHYFGFKYNFYIEINRNKTNA